MTRFTSVPSTDHRTRTELTDQSSETVRLSASGDSDPTTFIAAKTPVAVAFSSDLRDQLQRARSTPQQRPIEQPERRAVFAFD